MHMQTQLEQLFEEAAWITTALISVWMQRAVVLSVSSPVQAEKALPTRPVPIVQVRCTISLAADCAWLGASTHS
jgi:hypothetical protein